MKKNIVLIETAEGSGTGLLYPCKYDCSISNTYFNSFIIFTNRHVLDGLGRNAEPDKDIQRYVKLQIYDDNGKCIEKNDIKRVLIHNPIKDMYQHNDIGALLVCIDYNVPITLETRVYQNKLHNRDIIYMEGYPGIMIDDEVSQKVQLQGMKKEIFPDNAKIGVYQIKDDYHWYNNLKDLKLMQGFSGSPVYIEHKNQPYLLGINQSIANAGNGENPFKLVYYLKMQYILEYLSKSDCIRFRRESEHTYWIEWVYGFAQKVQTYEDQPTLLLIGGSGSGKSSFVKNFSYNHRKLHTTNDGQTTRTNVAYEFAFFCESQCAEVKFLTQEKFRDYLSRLNGVRPMLFLYQKLLGISAENLPKSKWEYLSDAYYLLKYIMQQQEIALVGKKEIKKMQEIEEILILSNGSKAELEYGKLFEIYETVIEVLLTYIPIDAVKVICDKRKIEKIIKIYKNSSRNKNDTVLEEMIYKEWPQIRGGVLIEKLKEYCKNCETMKYKQYQENCFEYIKRDIYKDSKNIYEQNIKVLTEKWEDQLLQKDFIEMLFNAEGFFNIEEFTFFLSKEEFMVHMCSIVAPMLNITPAESTRKDGDFNNIASAIEDIYKEAHKFIKGKMVKSLNLNENLRYKVQLDTMTSKEEGFLTRCLQVTEGESLTGFIDYVVIQDRISDEYSTLLKDLKIKKLRVLDTCGLDHVDEGKQMENILLDIVYKYQEDMKIQPEDFSIIYTKKLDAGRPDELRNILPVIWKVLPQAPVYTVFTGIDIFYSENVNQQSRIIWDRANERNCPKSVRYLLSEKAMKDIVRNVDYKGERKNNLFLVLRNNLIPYCGRKDMVDASFFYYSNNLYYMRKLLSSIIMKESSSMEIVNIAQVKRILKDESNKAKIERMLGVLFENASILVWNFHHMTVYANYRNITSNDDYAKLGFSRTLHQQWNQLFYEGYSDMIRNDSEEFVQMFDNGQAAVEAALANMRTRFLGDDVNLGKKILDIDRKNEFRKNLEKMYEFEEVYGGDNPFKGKDNGGDNPLKGKDNGRENLEGKRRYLNNVVNFAKGYWKIKEIRDIFVDVFIAAFIEQMEQDNKIKAEKLMKLNENFLEVIEQLERDFTKKYDVGDSAQTKRKLKTILTYYMEHILTSDSNDSEKNAEE